MYVLSGVDDGARCCLAELGLSEVAGEGIALPPVALREEAGAGIGLPPAGGGAAESPGRALYKQNNTFVLEHTIQSPQSQNIKILIALRLWLFQSLKSYNIPAKFDREFLW